MTPSRRVCFSAICCGCLLMLATGPARAQSYEDTRRILELSPEPLARSPRALGMGRLTLVANDARNRIGLWSFAGSPAGILEDDSVSTLELAPGTASASSVQDVVGFQPAFERQELGAREVRMQYEAWRRASQETAYGFAGDFGFLRYDRPFSESLERRTIYTQPRVSPVLNGRIPFASTNRLRYALRGFYGYQSIDERYKTFTVNSAGSYLDQDGLTVDPPDFFTPDESSVRSLGVGAALSFRVADPLTLAAGFDHLSNAIRGVNEGSRYASENAENRPYENLQLSMVGRVGKESGTSFEHGGDLRSWTSQSDASWVFTISAGVGAIPVLDRGKLYDREEKGWLARERVKLTLGSLELGAAYTKGHRKVTIFQPVGRDYESSFNNFLNRISNRTGADSLALPDSIRTHEVAENAWEAAGGVAWTFPGRRAILGVELHTGEEESELSLLASGPKRVTSEGRVGLEFAAAPTLALRGGYLRRQEDRDDFTEQNEFTTNGMTLGFGLRPAASRWSVEAGYAIEWIQADFSGPSNPRGSVQQFDSRIRWGF